MNQIDEVKDSDKYKISLKFINKILINIGKGEVDDLTKFMNIDRKLLLTDSNKQIFCDMESELFDHFDKVKCGWYRRKTTKNYFLTFMRYMCSDIGLQFTFEQKEIYTTINGESYRKSHTYYCIKK